MVGGVEPGWYGRRCLTVGAFHEAFGHTAQQTRHDPRVDDQSDGQLSMVRVAATHCLDDRLGRAAGVVVDEEQQQRPTGVVGRLEHAAGGDSLEAEGGGRLAGREWLGHAAIVV